MGVAVEVVVCFTLLLVEVKLEMAPYLAGDLEGNIYLTYADFDVFNPEFTITSVTTGGPATNVTWKRNSATITTNSSYSMNTVIVNRTTAQYNHTLSVTGRLGGVYKCIVWNNRPSEAVMSLEILGNILSCQVH